ncbi:hypothetical protein [Nocardioides euryhalodurans]|uniref:Uncharacterized protein n=1 Tax=Nocardioides euryhalodurans TaxID=2518370 RepID=A0A4P7GNR3_9ACTN|nr:hypothetical protein [Nocardioides euryhalodurans]QBR93564.1 hypothetical protein EXE57_15765 [Nocardioides euryhalodurans]
MTDRLEQRLADGLAGTAERAPHPGDLGAGARVRLRRRRRTTAATVAAALAVVAIPVGLTVLGGGGSAGDPDRDEPTVTDSVPTGWRTETWRDLSLSVPPEWTWGGGTSWCTEGSLEEAGSQVSRPGGMVPAIACEPSYGYGAHFLEPSRGELPPGTEGAVQQYRGSRYPEDSWIGYVSTGQAAVWVVTDERTLTRQVLDSVEPVGEVDANGCATRLEMSAPSTSGRVSVCRYAGDGWLEQSELLSKAGSQQAAAALGSAPPAEGHLCASTSAVTVRLVGGGVDATLDLTCEELVLTYGQRRLTEDVLYWALSPGWSGAVSDDVPLPPHLRGE